MTSQEITKRTLNHDWTEEKLKNYLKDDFRKTIISILDTLYEQLKTYNKNQELIKSMLLILESIAKEEQNIKNLKIFHGEMKKLISNIHKHLNPKINYQLLPIIKQIQTINKGLKQTITVIETAEKIEVIEQIIYNNRNLKIISGLIRDNKNILKIKDINDENILYKLLKRYSNLKETSKDEINYLYQVISLFINSEEMNIEIIRNADYYISALSLENIDSKHVQQIKQQLEQRKQPITLKELEAKYQIYTRYPESIEQELYTFHLTHDGVNNLRKQPCFTIDDENARCLDDALYWEKNKDGSYTLYVHITYLPALIPYESKINKESIKRVETYYLIDETYCLYPDYVSNYLASLLPNNNRYTQTGIWLVEPDMTLVEDSFKLIKSTINSHHKLTYEGADEIIGSRSNSQLSRTLTELGEFALKQRKINAQKEVYRKKENSQSNNPNHESRLVDKSVAANIVQECALLFGRSKAEFYKKQGLPYIFRACGEQQNLRLTGNLLKKINQEGQRQFSEMIAHYTDKPQKHHGLGYEAYCHGGSPARRSPDGQNQYIDEDLLFTPNPSDKTVYIWEERTNQLAKYYNETSQRIEAFSSQYNYLTNKRLIREFK